MRQCALGTGIGIKQGESLTFKVHCGAQNPLVINAFSPGGTTCRVLVLCEKPKPTASC